MNQPVELRHRHFLSTTRDSHAAARLVVAEQVQTLVSLLRNVDQAVERIGASTSPTEIVKDIPPIPPVNITVPSDAAEFIKHNYMA